MDFKRYKNRHLGQDIYIIGSGQSLQFYNKDFFNGKITIGVNLTFRFIDVQYVITHHHNRLNECLESKKPVFTTLHDIGQYNKPKTDNPNVITYKHNHNLQRHYDLRTIGTDALPVAGTIVFDAISLAHYMGAKNILLVGCDGVMINKKTNIDGYYKTGFTKQELRHIRKTRGLIGDYAQILKSYNINIYSLWPFTDFTMDGLEITK